MATIHQLPSADALAGNDEFPFYQISNGDTRKVTAATIAASVSALIDGPVDETQYALSTSGGAFTLLVVPVSEGGSVWAQLEMTTSVASGSITLPTADDRANGQEVLVTVTRSVSSLSVAGGDAAVNGAPVSLAANGFFRMRYDSVNNAWYRIG